MAKKKTQPQGDGFLTKEELKKYSTDPRAKEKAAAKKAAAARKKAKQATPPPPRKKGFGLDD